MIKDMDYYRSLDLDKARKEIESLGSDRGNAEVFVDAIQSLVVAADERTVSIEEVEQVLGTPDRKIMNQIGLVLEYDWLDSYGPVHYSSSTPFQFAGEVCKGLAEI